MKFSERLGKRTSKLLQKDSLDAELKNSLWNVFHEAFISGFPPEYNTMTSNSKFYGFIKVLWINYYKEPVDEIPNNIYKTINIIRYKFFNLFNYLDIYEFIEFTVATGSPVIKPHYVETLNAILKKECSAYRFVNYELVPITNDSEIAEIEKAIDATKEDKLKGVNIHLNEAIKKLSDKINPDYRNSIKESVSALEALCQVITGEEKTELSKTLKLLKTKIKLHGALEEGFIKIYSYTSDGDGIRHAMLDEDNLDQEDALYMLVSFSSFINYLIIKSQKAGISFK